MSSFSYLFFHWHCFNVSLFCQCSIVVLHCSAVFWLFRQCSVIQWVFQCSSGAMLFQPCSIVPWVFHMFWCSWFYSMPFEPYVLFTKNDQFFIKQYMGHAVLSLNEVYQIYLKNWRKKNSFWRKVLENPWKDDVVQIIFHTLDLNLLKILPK